MSTTYTKKLRVKRERHGCYMQHFLMTAFSVSSRSMGCCCWHDVQCYQVSREVFPNLIERCLFFQCQGPSQAGTNEGTFSTSLKQNSRALHWKTTHTTALSVFCPSFWGSPLSRWHTSETRHFKSWVWDYEISCADWINPDWLYWDTERRCECFGEREDCKCDAMRRR